MKVRNLEEVRKEVGAIRDLAGEPVESGIKDLVIGLRRWGIKTEMSCEGHLDHGFCYPWVDVARGSLKVIAKILSIWWSRADEGVPAADQPKWLMKSFAGMIRIIPEDKRTRSLEEMQEDAESFGKFLQKIPDDFFEGGN